MARTAGGIGALALLLAACAPAGGPDTGRSAPETCGALFQQFDFVKETMSIPSGWSDRGMVPLDLQSRIAALWQHDCMTRPGDLTLSGEVQPIAGGGASIPPTTVHAGVVTDMAAEAQVIGFFEARNLKMLSLGEPGLGRRIYIGGFTTTGERDAALALARQAGFASPYVIRYGPYMRP